MADQFTYEKSKQSELEMEPFVQKQVLYVIDQNNGAYNGQVQIDTAPLANAGKYADYSQAYFQIPLVVRLSATSASAQDVSIQTLQSAFAAGLKSGYFNLIHSMSVEYNNTSVVQLTPYTNFFTNYKLLTSFSKDDLDKYGSLLGFYPDSTISTEYGAQAAPDTRGHGSLNNKNLPQWAPDVFSFNSVAIAQTNWGYYTRQVRTTALTPATLPTSSFTTAALMGSVGQNYFVLGTAGNVDSKIWYVLATIRLKDVADFFEKLPLTKGAFIRFIINTNTASHGIRATVAGGVLTDIACTSNIITGGSTPLLLANGDTTGNGFEEIAAACVALGNNTYDFTLAVSIARDSTLSLSHPTLQNCRLYVPVYQMTPEAEKSYLARDKVKKVVYHDIYNYQTDVSISAGIGQYNVLLTNGIPNIKSVVIIPYAAASANNTANGAQAISPYGSPFASEPSTTTPLIQFTNSNIQISGANVFTSNELYDFQQFSDELSSANAINGGKMTGLSSGLISFDMFEWNYRYFVCDVSRRLPSEDNVPKSVQISGTIQSSLSAIQLMVFVEFAREIKIDVSTGQLLA